MAGRAHGPRRRIAVAALSIGLLAVLVTCSAPVLAWSANSARCALPPVAAIAQRPGTIGMAEGSDLFHMTDAQREQTFEEMAALGIQNVRIGIFWYELQRTEGGPINWDLVDRMVDEATERNMNILGTVWSTPDWAHAAQDAPNRVCHPDPDKYTAFIGAVAARYKGRIAAYEVWNEPTTTMFWDPVSPEVYTDLVKASYAAVKAADCHALVIAGSVVAGPTYPDGSAISPVEFVQRMYAAGAKGHFDAISYHPYQYLTSFPNSHQDGLEYPIQQLDMMRAIMVANGDQDLKIWVSEYGQPTTTVKISGQDTVLDEARQAQHIGDLVRTWQGIDYAGPVFIYETRDADTDGDSVEDHFGLFHDDGTAKPAAGVLASLVGEFAPPKAPVNPIAAFVERIVRAVG